MHTETGNVPIHYGQFIKKFKNAILQVYVALNILELTRSIQIYEIIFAVKNFIYNPNFPYRIAQKIMNALCVEARLGWRGIIMSYTFLPFIVLHFSTLCDVYTVQRRYTGLLQKSDIH